MSELARGAACPGSFALPQAQTTNEYAESGTARHAIGEDAIKRGALELIPDEIRELIPPGAITRAEVAIAYNHVDDTARMFAPGDPRHLDETRGHIDLLIVDHENNRAVVVDYKGHKSVGRPEENDQLMGYAVAAARAFGVSEVLLVIAYVETVGEPARLSLTRPLVAAKLDEIDLLATRARIGSIRARVAAQHGRAVPDVREGPQCEYCPGYVHCPIKRDLVVRLATGDEALELSELIPLTVETAAVAYERLATARDMLAKIERAVYSFASQVDVPLRNGNVLGKRTKRGNKALDADVIYEVVAETHGPEIAMRALDRKATQAGLKRVLPTASVKRVLELAEERGGVHSEPKEVIDEHHPNSGDTD